MKEPTVRGVSTPFDVATLFTVSSTQVCPPSGAPSLHRFKCREKLDTERGWNTSSRKGVTVWTHTLAFHVWHIRMKRGDRIQVQCVFTGYDCCHCDRMKGQVLSTFAPWCNDNCQAHECIIVYVILILTTILDETIIRINVYLACNEATCLHDERWNILAQGNVRVTWSINQLK